MASTTIAKNLLEEKNCNNCLYKEGTFCTQPVVSKTNYMAESLPKEKTCAEWEKRLNKKLNVKWTKETETDLTFNSEEGLIKVMSKELIKSMDEEINKLFETNS